MRRYSPAGKVEPTGTLRRLYEVQGWASGTKAVQEIGIEMRSIVFEQAVVEASAGKKAIDAEIDRLKARRALLEAVETLVRHVLAVISMGTEAISTPKEESAEVEAGVSAAERTSGVTPRETTSDEQVSLANLLSKSDALSRRITELFDKERRQLQMLATHDSLTGLFNRAAIMEHLDREISRAVRKSEPLGVMLADLDHFKSVNDRHGHLCGDEVLREAASRLQSTIRSYDVVGRYGGEEFLILFPGWNPESGTERIDEVLDSIRSRPFRLESENAELGLTCSAGIAVFRPHQDEPTVRAVLGRADAALYVAKNSGRNTARFETRLP